MSTIFDRSLRLSAHGTFRLGPIAFLTAILVPAALTAQITEFRGGELHLDLKGHLSPYGLASNTGARGALENVSSLYPSSSGLYGNPAALARLTGPAAQTDFFLPGLGLGIGSERMRLLRGDLREPIHALLTEPGHNVKNPEYPEVNLALYQSATFSSLTAAYPWRNYAFAMGVQQPLSGTFRFTSKDFALGLGAPHEASGDSVKMALTGDLVSDGSLSVTDWSMGAAGKPLSFLHWGVAYHLFQGAAAAEVSTDWKGAVTFADETHAFHDEDAGYPNAIGGEMEGDLQGVAHGVRIGAGLQWGTRFGVDGLATFSQSMEMEGRIAGTYHTFPAVQLNDDTIFHSDKVNESEPAHTRRNTIRVDKVELKLPWELGLSAFASFENYRFNLDYVYYMRGLALRYRYHSESTALDTLTNTVLTNTDGKDSVETTQFTREYQLRAGHQLAFGLEIHQVFFHFGALFYDIRSQDVLSEAVDYRPGFLPFIPLFNMGYHFPIGPKVRTTVSLFAFPVALFKTTVEVKL